MAIGTGRQAWPALRGGRGRAGLASVLLIGLVVLLLPTRGVASGRGLDDDHGGRFCSATAAALFRACGFEVRDDHEKAVAICINVSDSAERAECFAEATASRRESERRCRKQRAGRRTACRSLGEDRYDPEFDPASFDDPRNPTNPNPYFPLRVGNLWEYRGGTEANTVEVLNQTRLIDGVTCIVVKDQVTDDGDVVEDTDDWFALAKDGNVWYCGEEVKDFESFEGDDPRRPELVSIDGSFKAGRNRDKPGIIFQASPTPGQSYIEEFSLGNAEDIVKVLSTTYAFGADPDLDRLVPRPLAQLLCSGDCVVTRNHSLLEPGVFDRKYYARGIGFFLEVNPDTGTVTQLVDCNFDPRCAALPKP